jgi:hypothetical protein
MRMTRHRRRRRSRRRHRDKVHGMMHRRCRRCRREEWRMIRRHWQSALRNEVDEQTNHHR